MTEASPPFGAAEQALRTVADYALGKHAAASWRAVYDPFVDPETVPVSQVLAEKPGHRGAAYIVRATRAGTPVTIVGIARPLDETRLSFDEQSLPMEEHFIAGIAADPHCEATAAYKHFAAAVKAGRWDRPSALALAHGVLIVGGLSLSGAGIPRRPLARVDVAAQSAFALNQDAMGLVAPVDDIRDGNRTSEILVGAVAHMSQVPAALGRFALLKLERVLSNEDVYEVTVSAEGPVGTNTGIAFRYRGNIFLPTNSHFSYHPSEGLLSDFADWLPMVCWDPALAEAEVARRQTRPIYP